MPRTADRLPVGYPFRIRDPRLLRASLVCFALTAVIAVLWFNLAGCASPKAPSIGYGLTMRRGASNGPENENRLGASLKYSFAALKAGDYPIRKDATAHPIISGNALTGYVTKGTANHQPDASPLTRDNYSGFVLVQPGLDPMAIGYE